MKELIHPFQGEGQRREEARLRSSRAMADSSKRESAICSSSIEEGTDCESEREEAKKEKNTSETRQWSSSWVMNSSVIDTCAVSLLEKAAIACVFPRQAKLGIG